MAKHRKTIRADVNLFAPQPVKRMKKLCNARLTSSVAEIKNIIVQVEFKLIDIKVLSPFTSTRQYRNFILNLNLRIQFYTCIHSYCPFTAPHS